MVQSNPDLFNFREVIYKGSPRAEKKLKQQDNFVGKLYGEEYKSSSYTWRMTPSEVRKKAWHARTNAEKYHLCVMGVGQLLGIIGLPQEDPL